MSERVAVFDLDGTITRIDTYVHFLLTVMWRRPLRAVRALWLPLAVVVNKCGLRDNSWLKCIFLGSVLGGLKRENLDSIVQHFVDRILRHQIRPGARAAIKWHRKAGHRIVLATASFDFYVNALAKQLDVDDVVCTESVWCDNRLTSNLRSRNCYGEEKLRRLILLLCKENDRPYIYTYTDHYSDRLLLEWADEGVAVNPDSRLREYCSLRGHVVVDWGQG